MEKVVKENVDKNPIDIFANLKGTSYKTSLEQDMLDFVKELNK